MTPRSRATSAPADSGCGRSSARWSTRSRQSPGSYGRANDSISPPSGSSFFCSRRQARMARSSYGATCRDERVSLDTEKLHRLRAKSFDKLYSDHAGKRKEMVQTALAYAQTCVGAGEKVRIGDVVAVVQNAIRIDPTFEKHMKDKG